MDKVIIIYSDMVADSGKFKEVTKVYEYRTKELSGMALLRQINEIITNELKVPIFNVKSIIFEF